jgi:hypothetical protein
MRQSLIAGLEGGNGFSVELALPFGGFGYFPESCPAGVKRGSVPSVAEDGIGESSSQRIEMARKVVVESVVPFFLESDDCVR